MTPTIQRLLAAARERHLTHWYDDGGSYDPRIAAVRWAMESAGISLANSRLAQQVLAAWDAEDAAAAEAARQRAAAAAAALAAAVPADAPRREAVLAKVADGWSLVAAVQREAEELASEAAAANATPALRNPRAEADALCSAWGVQTLTERDDEAAKRSAEIRRQEAESAAARQERKLCAVEQALGVSLPRGELRPAADVPGVGRVTVPIYYGDATTVTVWVDDESYDNLPISTLKESLAARIAAAKAKAAAEKAAKEAAEKRLAEEHERLYAALEQLLGPGARNQFRASAHNGRAQLSFAHHVNRKTTVFYIFDRRGFARLGHGRPTPVSAREMQSLLAAAQMA